VIATVQLGGAGLFALIALSVLIWASSAYVAYDALRRRRTDYAGVLEGRWFYALPQMVFFVGFVAWWIPWVQTNAAWISNMLYALPIALAQQMAFLLRVVYPTGKRLERRLDAECELLRDEADAAETKAARPRSADVDGFFDPDNPND
jgi:hypothetical protein